MKSLAPYAPGGVSNTSMSMAHINTGYIIYELKVARTAYLPYRTLEYSLANILHGFCSRKAFAGLLVSSII